MSNVVIKANDGLLTNIEVLQVLEQKREDRQRGKNDKDRLLTTETINYIKSTQTTEVKKMEDMKTYLNAVKKICGTGDSVSSLTEAELIQLANHVPTSVVEVHLIVEECAERLTDEQIESIVALSDSVMSADVV